jgi:hypothetical protein
MAFEFGPIEGSFTGDKLLRETRSRRVTGGKYTYKFDGAIIATHHTAGDRQPWHVRRLAVSYPVFIILWGNVKLRKRPRLEGRARQWVSSLHLMQVHESTLGFFHETTASSGCNGSQHPRL